MKIVCILILISFLHVEGQRRTQTRQEASNSDPSPVRGRGRSRFTNTESEYSPPSETSNRRIPSRRRQDTRTAAPVEKPNYPLPLSSTLSYAVQEMVDEGGATPKLKALPEPNFEPQQSSSKSMETDPQFAEGPNSAESSVEKFSEEQDIPTVKVGTDKSSLFREDLEDIQPKVNEKVVPITRNNVRSSGSREMERRADVRNGASRSGNERGFRNSNARITNDNIIPNSRGGSSRSRNENTYTSSRRASVIEDSRALPKQESFNEVPPLRDDNPSSVNKISDPMKDEAELRKEIVRNSMPKLPPPIGIPEILSQPPLPKKTIKKTIRTRLNTNSRNEEVSIPPRGRSNKNVVENFESVPRVSPRTLEEYSASPRGRSPSEDTQQVRTRSNTTPRNNDAVTSGRSRTRATRKPAEVVPQTVTIPSRRNGRKRADSPSTTSAPAPRRASSVFSAKEETPSIRSRTGRKIEAEVPKSQIDLTQNSRSVSNRGRSRGSSVAPDQVSSGTSRRQTFRSRNEDQVTRPSRQRFNARSPLNIDESKLEVLPLFEGETKIISDSGRKPNQLDELIHSATESENKVINPPASTIPSISTRSDVSISSRVSSMKVRRKPQRKTEIKESVESQVTEVTSKRTVTRKPIARPGGKRLTNKKSLEAKLNGLTSSEENISDSDNYPEPFKALIHSKKQVKESRPSNVPAEDTKTKKIDKIVSSSEAPRSVLASPNVPSRTTTYPIKYGGELDNEVRPKTSTTSTTFKPTKKRLAPSFKNLGLKNKKTTTASAEKIVSRSTLKPTKEPKENKFHSKFNSATKEISVSSPKPFSATKGLYTNRKNKDNEKYSLNKTRNVVDIGSNRGQLTNTPIQKSSRYSSKYRSSGSSRSAPRTSTAPPAYIPTIPSVRSYSATAKPQEDHDLGIEYITFDIPNRGISSANLIKGDYPGSEDTNSNSLDPKQAKGIQTTEKPVSIIERIINSITGINITTEPTNANFVSPSSPEPTKSSAILSLAPKKSIEKSSRTDDSTQQKLKSNKRDASTSEKPTTIIQRILDSLSAIQATTTETTTVATTDNPKQVGTNFNTLSAITTTPSQLDLEIASFSSTPAPSTTMNPLVVLDTISDEQVLQKRTIGKLLDILNSLTTQHPDSTKLPEPTKLVYVTPKLSNYMYATPSVTPSITSKPSTGENESSSELFTSTPEVNMTDTTTTDLSATTTTMSSTADAPLSISLDVSTTPQYIEDNILFSTTPRSHPIIMNIKSLLALNGFSTTSTPTSTYTNSFTTTRKTTSETITSEIPTATSLFTPAMSTTLKPLTTTNSETTTTLMTNTPSMTTSITTTSFPMMKSTTEEPLNTSVTTITSMEMTSSTASLPSTTISISSTNEVPTISSTDDPSISVETSTVRENTILTEGSTEKGIDIPEGTTSQSSTENIFSYFSTIPTFSRFEVSPDSVSIFSANDLISNAITPDDFLTSTISIPGKTQDSFLTTGGITDSTSDDKDSQNTFETSTKATNSPIGFDSSTIQGRITSTPTVTVPTTSSDTQQTASESTTLPTEINATTISMTGSNDQNTTSEPSILPIDTTTITVTTTGSIVQNTTSESTTLPNENKTTTFSSVTTVNTSNTPSSTTTPSIANGTTPVSGRMGKLLQNVEDEVSNNIDTSSMGPDYFIFAVLPNNTILRKRPLVYPKETPFVIVGVYPNNTVIRKYPNGTLIPMEPVIRVSGFDTRANPPPLQDITSNQVTPDQGNEMDNPNIQMVSTTLSSSVNSMNTTTNKPETIPTTAGMTALIDSTTVESVTREEPSSNTVIPDNVISSSTLAPSTTLPSLSELLNGKTVQAYNSLVNNTPPVQESTTKVEDNAIGSSTITVLPTVTVTPLSISSTPSFLSTLISTLQSIGTTRFPANPTTQIPFRFSSTYRAPLTTTILTTTAATTTTSIPTTTAVPTTKKMETTTEGTTTTARATTTTVPTTRRAETTTKRERTTTTRTITTTVSPITSPPITTIISTSTPVVMMSEMEDSSTPPAFTSKPAVSSRTGKGLLSTTVFPYFNPSDFPLLSLFSTERPRRTNIDLSSTVKTTTIPTTTTVQTSTTEKEITTESLEELLKKPIDSIKPKKKLTEQQKQDLEMIRRLEQEQAAILKQLSLLTNLNLNGFGNGQSGNLANRIISLAKDRDSRKVKTPRATTTPKATTTTRATTTEVTTLKSDDETEKERMRQIENLIKLLNMNGVTPSPQKETTYGTSNDAILAALLKERGIGPSTPKQLAKQLDQSGFFTQQDEVTTMKPTRRTTKKPKVTTQATRGPLLQRLGWLLDAIAPPPTKAPTRKTKTTTKKPKPKVVDEDILTNEPTHITPVVSPPPKTQKQNSLSQEEIQKLIKQLEAIQKDPSAAKNLDLSSFKSLQSLNRENVQVFMPGSSGVSERETRPVTRAISQRKRVTTTETPSVETTTKSRKSGSRAVRTSTISPVSVSNSISDDIEDETPATKARPTLPPVRLRPVSGVSDEAGSMVRGRLLSAAVNVTRAISGFLGSAFQDAVKSLGRTLSSGSLNFAGSSSIPTNREVPSIDGDYS